MECADTTRYRRRANHIVNLTLTTQSTCGTRGNAPPAWTLQCPSCKENQGHACLKAGQLCPLPGRGRQVEIMKHPSSREFFTYWDGQRGGERAPDRSDIEPGPVRGLLGDIFVLSYDPVAGHRFRVAGTRVCALLGRDLKAEGFAGLFVEDTRREIEDLIGIVAEELLAIVAGVTATAPDGARVPLELLLLPFN